MKSMCLAAVLAALMGSAAAAQTIGVSMQSFDNNFQTLLREGIGARGTAFQNLKLLANHFPLEEIRISSRRPESRERLAARVRAELGIACRAVDDIPAACRDADIIVEATRLEKPTVLIPADAVKPGAPQV